MSLSRGTAPRRFRKQLALGGIVAVAALAGWQLWLRLRPDPAPWLAEARQLVAEAASRIDTTRSPAGAIANSLPEAARLLERYLAAGGAEPDAARLLLAAAVVDRKPEHADGLLEKVELAHCGTLDLDRSALVFFAAGRSDTAGRLIDAALARADERVETLRTAAVIRFDQGRTEEVLGYCREWSRLSPADALPWRLMTLIYEDSGMIDLAADAYRGLLVRVPNDAEARRALVDKLVQLGDTEGARREFDQIAKRGGGAGWQERLTEARLLDLEGKAEAARARLDEVLGSQPRTAGALLLRGKLLSAQGDLDGAIESLGAALSQDPTLLESHYLLGQALARKGETGEAAKHLTLHEKLRSTKVLINTLERQAAGNPDDLAVRQRLAKLYAGLGMEEQARFWRRTAGH